MDICGLHSLGLQLGCLLVLILDSLDLLLLNVHWRNFHSKNDVLYFRLSQTCHVDIVLLGIICKNQILQLDLHLDPLLI